LKKGSVMRKRTDSEKYLKENKKDATGQGGSDRNNLDTSLKLWKNPNFLMQSASALKGRSQDLGARGERVQAVEEREKES